MERKAFLQHVSLFLCHNIYFLLFLTLLIFFMIVMHVLMFYYSCSAFIFI